MYIASRFTFCLVSLSFLAVAQGAGGPDSAVVEQVRAAWQKRHALIRSFQYECDLGSSRSVPQSKAGKPSPFGPDWEKDVPNAPVLLHKAVGFTLSGEKLAYSETGDHWDEGLGSVGTSTFKGAFDGRAYRNFMYTGVVAQGFVNPASTRAAPIDAITKNRNQTAMRLWQGPSDCLNTLSYSIDRMEETGRRAFCDGFECVELSVPAKGKFPWRVLIHADPSRDYAPLEYIEENAGNVVRQLTVQYVQDTKVGWRVSAWSDISFNSKGLLTDSVVCKVKNCSINEAIPESTFMLEFPVGARVCDVTSGEKQYYTVTDSRERNVIAVSDFSRLPPGAQQRADASQSADTRLPEVSAARRVAVAVVLTAAISILLVVLVVRRFRKGVTGK
jgi:hypothetical protein